jgi:hypothetical protein
MENDKAESPRFAFERRSHSRFMVELPVEYRRSQDSRLRPGHTVNFSEDGLMVLVSEQMEMGESLEMKIYFSSVSGLVTIAAIVKVIWTDIEAKEGGYYRVGVRYADISPADMDNLKGFLNMYADPNQAAAEINPRAGGLFKPSKPSAPESPGRPPPVAAFPILTFLKRILGLGRRAMRKGKSR